MSDFLTDPYEIAKYIKNATKKTPVKLYLKGKLADIDFSAFKYFGDEKSGLLFGEANDVLPFLAANQAKITDYVLENDRRNSAIPMIDMTKINARIEPGVWIREHAVIHISTTVLIQSYQL